MSEDMFNIVVGTVVSVIMAACVGLFVRVRALEAKRAAADVKLDALQSEAFNVKDLKLDIAERYVRREDWVPAMSRILGALERQGVMLARQDEKLKFLVEDKNHD